MTKARGWLLGTLCAAAMALSGCGVHKTDGDPCSSNADCSGGFCQGDGFCGGSACKSDGDCNAGWKCISSTDPILNPIASAFGGSANESYCVATCGSCPADAHCAAGESSEALCQPGSPLTASAGGPYSGEVNKPITFKAEAHSSVPIRSYTWSFGDATQPTGQTVTHTFSVPENATFSVTVVDDTGNSVEAQGQLTVCMPAGGPCNPEGAACCAGSSCNGTTCM